MISNYLLSLTSISQWALFLGIASVLFGWIEKRDKFIFAGQMAFLLIGFMAVWIILTNQIFVPETTNNIIPKQLKVLAYFKGMIVFLIITSISILLKLFKLRFQKASLIVLMLFALFMFFMVFNIQQMAN
ncbi:MAG: hypothetical protein A2066_09175 [Bacteroidetes bacterium GWB2_41_8]|nr:MAG: hypothetical protein A2066_09175 [Bacteroidetes bacterium GWB2_41_8]